MQILASIIIDSVTYGMTLFVIAVGLSVTLGLIRVVNLAHGLFAVLGGYFAWQAMISWKLGYAPAAVLAVVLTAVAGLVLERLLFSRVYRRSALDQVLLSIGIMFVGIAACGAVFGDGIKTLPLPPSLSGPVELGFRAVPAQRLLVIACGAAVVLAMWLAYSRTKIGIRLRAVVDHTDAAESIGIDSRLFYAVAFALGAGLAGLGGILGAEIMQIEPFYPTKYLVTFLAVVAIGGLGNIWGSLGAAMLLSGVETSSKYLLPSLGSILSYGAMLAVLSFRPHGLFGGEESE
jgi:branched-chain amino acid transport system permease protein